MCGPEPAGSLAGWQPAVDLRSCGGEHCKGCTQKYIVDHGFAKSGTVEIGRQGKIVEREPVGKLLRTDTLRHHDEYDQPSGSPGDGGGGCNGRL